MEVKYRVYSSKTGKKGFASLARKFEQFNTRTQRSGNIITREVALDIRRDTRENIRNSFQRQSGILERSPFFRKVYGGSLPTYVVGVGAEYAHFLEYGTGRYNMLGGGRQDSWVYKSATDGLFYTTYGTPGALFFSDAVERNLNRYPDKLRDKFRRDLR